MPTKPKLKTSIYLAPDVLDIIARREVGKGTRSEVIRSCVERYDEVCRRACPVLTDAEWRYLFGVLDEEWLAAGPSPTYIPAAVRDAEERGRAAAPDTWPLGNKVPGLARMTYVELVAILDEAERWYAAIARGEQPQTRAQR